MPYKLTIALKDGTRFQDTKERLGRTPEKGEHLTVHIGGGNDIACHVEQVLPGACAHPTMSFEAVDDVRAKEE